MTTSEQLRKMMGVSVSSVGGVVKTLIFGILAVAILAVQLNAYSAHFQRHAGIMVPGGMRGLNHAKQALGHSQILRNSKDNTRLWYGSTVYGAPNVTPNNGAVPSGNVGGFQASGTFRTPPNGAASAAAPNSGGYPNPGAFPATTSTGPGASPGTPREPAYAAPPNAQSTVDTCQVLFTGFIGSDPKDVYLKDKSYIVSFMVRCLLVWFACPQAHFIIRS
jgi:hypothetical protein